MRDGDPDGGGQLPNSAAGGRSADASGRDAPESSPVPPAGGGAVPQKNHAEKELAETGSAGASRQWMRLSGAGLELAVSVLVLGGIGYWVDEQRQHETPYLGIAGVLLGFVLGMYRLIRLAQEIGGR